jgi:hypothetical protein
MSGTASASDRRPPSDRATLTVCVYDKAGVPGVLLTEAEERASAVFGMREVNVKWVHARDGTRLKLSRPFKILVIAKMPASVKIQAGNRSDDVMGQAVPLVDRAYVYYDRLLNIVTPTRDIVTTLGDVMAHELGHLTLPPGHSTVGIMRPSIDMMSRRVQTFTESEGRELQQRLHERSNSVETN